MCDGVTDMLNTYINEAKALPKDPYEVSQADADKFKDRLSNTYRKSGLDYYTTPARKQALDKLSEAAANKGEKFTLDKMTEMINKDAKKLEEQKKAAGPRAGV